MLWKRATWYVLSCNGFDSCTVTLYYEEVESGVKEHEFTPRGKRERTPSNSPNNSSFLCFPCSIMQSPFLCFTYSITRSSSNRSSFSTAVIWKCFPFVFFFFLLSHWSHASSFALHAHLNSILGGAPGCDMCACATETTLS